MQETPPNNLRELREAAGLSQRQLADAVGLTDQTISNIERGARTPSVETALTIARVLGVSVERVFLLATSTANVGNPAEDDEIASAGLSEAAGPVVASARLDGAGRAGRVAKLSGDEEPAAAR